MTTKSVTAAAEFEYTMRLHFLGCADVTVERSEMGVAFWLDGDILGSGETLSEAYKAASKQALAWRRAAKR